MGRPFTPPQEVGEFRLERMLGEGISAQVWLAIDTLLERKVAMKFAHTEVSAEARLRFLMEARVIARLRHPNVVAVHHAGEISGCPFLVTELLSGHSLADVPRPVDGERALQIGIDLARGLAAAHAAGVLHRDIKPANTFECADGTVKILDFGLAKLQEDKGYSTDESIEVSAPNITTVPLALDKTVSAGTHLVQTRPGTVVGTPLYMAPEVWRGESATQRSDVYSLGILLYELIAGETPYKADNALRLREEVLTTPAPRLRDRVPGIKALADIIDRCLSRDPRMRPTADELRELLEALTERARTTLGDTKDEAGNPYRGLLAFGPEHHAMFFGREAEIRAVLAELRAAAIVVVVGPSGAGKSSLILAGVVPRIKGGALGDGSWQVATMVPGRRPLDALAQATSAALGLESDEIEECLRAEPSWLGQELRARAGAAGRVLVVLDQLEELWTLAEPTERRGFMEALAELVAAAPAVRVIGTLRSDFMGRLEDLGILRAEVLRTMFVLGPMSSEGIRRAVVEPTHLRGYEFEADSLVDLLVAQATPGSLPLLQFALSALWEARDTASRQLTAEALDKMGGIKGALAAHADSVLWHLAPDLRKQARRMLLALVTAEGTRARREQWELVGETGEAHQEASMAALAALVQGRLLVVGEGEKGPAYEVAHEALLTGWPTLKRWLQEEASTREIEERVRRAAQEWERLGRIADGLWSERQLRELSSFESLNLGARERDFIKTSWSALRSARLRAWALRVGIPAAMVAVVLGSVGFGDWRESREIESFVSGRMAAAQQLEAEAETLEAR
ncbi:MAG: serine/threonine-protein kinase, partial [Pseudomonadota bacterium]